MNGIFSAETILDIQFLLIQWEAYLSDRCIDEEEYEEYQQFLAMRSKYGFTKDTLHKGFENMFC